MANTYEVGDRVKVLIERTWTDPKTKEEKTWEDYYAGTIITYHEFEEPTTNDTITLYKVSVDGVGDTKVAKELNGDGNLGLVSDTHTLACMI